MKTRRARNAGRGTRDAKIERNPKASRVRISAGKWKGRLVEVPSGARPTSSRAREALFDRLGPSIVGARVLDLYAGSGAVGLEALSRGAAAAVFVESDGGSLQRTLVRFGAVEPEAVLLPLDARTAVDRLSSRGQTFDLVFCDPPYAERLLPAGVARLVAPGGALVVQTDEKAPGPAPEGFSNEERRSYGRNVFHFFSGAPGSGL